MRLKVKLSNPEAGASLIIGVHPLPFASSLLSLPLVVLVSRIPLPGSGLEAGPWSVSTAAAGTMGVVRPGNECHGSCLETCQFGGLRPAPMAPKGGSCPPGLRTGETGVRGEPPTCHTVCKRYGLLTKDVFSWQSLFNAHEARPGHFCRFSCPGEDSKPFPTAGRSALNLKIALSRAHALRGCSWRRERKELAHHPSNRPCRFEV